MSGAIPEKVMMGGTCTCNEFSGQHEIFFL